MKSRAHRSPASERNEPLEPFRGSFVGREPDLGAIEAMIGGGGGGGGGGARLVTLLGPGGVGKTRLAHRLLSQLSPSFDAALFCDLSSARTAGDVVAAVGAVTSGVALGAATTPEQARDRVGRALGRRGRTLLVLDNLEQLEDAAIPLVAAWLAAAPRLVIIATSRVRLGLAGEAVHRLDPLATNDALSLFEDRARAIRGELTAEERAVAARIVALLEGLPLAVEMAAARLVILQPDELLERLSRPLAVLTSTARGDPDRHASMSRVLDRSWELLATEERRALAEMGVFVGGFTLAAAEAVLSTREASLSLVQRLADSSLLRATPARDTSASSRARYVPYEVVREYALERLAAEGRIDEARWAHARWFAARAAVSPAPALAELVVEEANLVAAAQFLGGARDGDAEARVLSLRVIAALGAVRMLRGGLDAWVVDVAAALDALSDEQRAEERLLVARARLGLARALHELGRSEAARAAYAEAGDAARDAGDASLESFALTGHGRLAAGLGEWEASVALFAAARAVPGASDAAQKLAHACHEFYGTETAVTTDEAAAVSAYVEVCRAGSDPRELAFWVTQLGRVHSELTRDEALAEASFVEGLAIARAAGDLRGEGFALFALGTHRMAFGRVDEARAMLTEAARTLREAGTPRYEAWSLGFLGTTHALAREWADARAVLDEAITLLRDVADIPREAHLLAFRGAVHARSGDRVAAAADFERAAAICPARSRYHGWTLTLCRAQMDVASGELAAPIALLVEAGWPRGEDPREVREWPWGAEFFEPRIAAKLLDDAIREVEAPRGKLVVAEDGSFFVLPSGARVACPGRGTLHRILVSLATARAERPGEATGAEGLVLAGWRGERLKSAAAQNRLHVALDQLRKLGLRELLLRGDAGWYLDPHVPFAWARAEH